MVHRFTIGVIVGADKIMVVDAGLGMSGDFRKQIKKVVGTKKPIICCCTHSNIDHVASAKQFDEAYMCHIDIDDDIAVGHTIIDRKCNVLYCVNEREKHPDFIAGGGGRVFAYHVNPADGSLDLSTVAHPIRHFRRTWQWIRQAAF